MNTTTNLTLKEVRGALLDNSLVYKYSSYWRTWSRVLQVAGPESQFVEVDLTPLNGQWLTDTTVRGINIRRHCTTPLSDDKFVLELPQQVEDDIKAHLSIGRLTAMFSPYLLQEIDWDKYSAHCNGGCPFVKCRK